MQRFWPELVYAQWAQTCSALHLYVQIVGKYRLAHAPWQNHSWQATLYVTGRGLTTSLVPDAGGIEIELDLVAHRLRATNIDGRMDQFDLGPGTVADFLSRFRSAVTAVGGMPAVNDIPSELPNPVPFSHDHAVRPYDRDAVTRYFRALVASDTVFKKFRTGFVGKSSPVHLFWGALDLAVTRFSGRLAPQHPGNVPGLPDSVVREAYDHEVASAGFWPGSPDSPHAMFYAYAYPTLDGFAEINIAPEEAGWHPELREFVLPYDAVRKAADPDQTLLQFLQSAYQGAADVGQWPRDALDCDFGSPARPRMPSTVR
ncbi:MAG: DUF5996 family protein [Devosia sp.]